MKNFEELFNTPMSKVRESLRHSDVLSHSQTKQRGYHEQKILEEVYEFLQYYGVNVSPGELTYEQESLLIAEYTKAMFEASEEGLKQANYDLRKATGRLTSKEKRAETMKAQSKFFKNNTFYKLKKIANK